MKGLFLVIEGLDASGKSTQTELLAGVFRKKGRKVRTLHFPRTDAKPYGELIAQFLRGDLGAHDAVHPRLTALLYALDRQQAAAELRAALAAGEVVIADRYIFSNMAYHRAKCPTPEAKKEMTSWIETLEYAHLGSPRPDLNLYLDVPFATIVPRLSAPREGADRAYLGDKADVNERDIPYQQRVNDEYKALCREKVRELGLVDCSGQGTAIADRSTIHSRILEALKYYQIAI